MLWFILILFAVLSAVLLSGRGGFLIAGYNTSSPEQKAKIDEKKLCRVMGAGMGVITLWLFAGACFGADQPDWYGKVTPVLIITDVLAMVLAANFGCKRTNLTEEEKAALEQLSKDPAQKRRERNLKRGSLLFTLACFGAAAFFLFTGNVSVRVENEKLLIKGSYWPDYTVALSEIQSVTCREGDFEVGRRTNGLGSPRLLEGHFKNEELGAYILYAYTDCKNYVLLETTNGDVVAVNGKDAEATKELYKTITEELD